MDDLTLLGVLQSYEDDSYAFVTGDLDRGRENALRDYERAPYGTEEEGLSQFVASDVFDTVETVLPDMLEIFAGSDQAVNFEPVGPEDEEAAEQATAVVNHVFYKQNNGFLVSYTAIKDALMFRNCAVMAYKDEQDIVRTERLKGLLPEQLQMVLEQYQGQEGSEAEITGQEVREIADDLGMIYQVVDVELRITKKTKRIRVEAFPPEDLLVNRTHNSPDLSDARYVCRLMPVTLSEVRQLYPGEDIGPEDMGSESLEISGLRAARNEDSDPLSIGETNTDDESLLEGVLRFEFVEVDYDGDGIAERRRIVRLGERILSNDVYSHVPIFTTSPYLRQHRWDGLSIADAVSDIQRLHTEILRGMVNSLLLANNPRTKVLTTADGTPLVNMDDLLDNRAGGVIRVAKDINGVQEMPSMWVGQQALPMLEVVHSMRENRIGVTRYNQGLDADSLNKTATGVQAIMSAAQRKTKLIARIFAETLFVPMFRSILKLLTEGDMQPISMRLNGKFVQYDPNEWHDGYDLTVNVGLGTGDKAQQGQQLMMLIQQQMMLMQAGGTLVDEKNIFNAHKRLIETMGYKQPSEFITDPDSPEMQQKKANQPPPPPPPEVLKMQADAEQAEKDRQLDAQKTATESQVKLQIAQMEIESKERIERMKIEADLEAKRMDAAARVSANATGGIDAAYETA